MEELKKHLKEQKENCKQHILDIVNENNGFRFSALNLQYAIADLKEIETIEQFIESEDFEMIKSKEAKQW